MARDGLHYAVRTIFLTGGPQSGHTSSEFHFLWSSAGTPALSDLNALHTAVQTFWNGAAGGSGTPAWYLGPQVSRAAAGTEIASYSLDVADPHHYYGSPVNVTTFQLKPGGDSNPLPNEVAAVLSYRADYGTDPEHGGGTRPRADDRGRIYIGPLDNSALATVTTPIGLTYAVLANGMVTACLNSLTTLRTSMSGAGWMMAVWSRKTGSFKAVNNKAMNNEFDTMRRRQVSVGLQN